MIAKEKQDAERAAELRRKLSEQKAEKDFKRYLEEAKEQGQRHVRCPGCSAIVVKSYGCNKMRCNVW